ncbi:MAG: hypothetical protein BIFFINMI_04087 [Phycisphaerae bacterium]|nr:hypothetical protein [Phycisphaerae bacterium]
MVFVAIVILWVASLCLHEYAHARVAYAGGDTSVAAKGYLTLNPARYVHPLMSIGLPLLFLAMGGIGLPGGAVYIDHSRLRSKRWEMAVSAAGPATNLLLAIGIGVWFRVAGPDVQGLPWEALAFFGLLQVTAVVLNLLPVPPLDGFGIISPLLSPEVRDRAARTGATGLLILFALFWAVPAASNAFWDAVFRVSHVLGIPPDLAWKGYQAFRPFKH